MIDRFIREHKFLSNYFPAPVVLDGLVYPSVEHAYQAAKTLEIDQRLSFLGGSAGDAKRRGQLVQLRPDWCTVKLVVMSELLESKFAAGDLKRQLLATRPEDLKEGNYWHDNYWGSCTCLKCNDHGNNNLGLLLMSTRNKFSIAG